MASWEDMIEGAEDRQPSGGKLHRSMNAPFYTTVMEIRNEFGTVIGELMIQELIPLQETEMKDRCYRVSTWEKQVNRVPERKKTLRFEQGPFPDED